MYYNFSLFPKRIRKLKDDHGLTFLRWHEESGVNPRTLELYTTGRCTPMAYNLATLAEYFQVSVDYLLGATPEPKDDPWDIIRSLFPDLTEEQVTILGSIIMQYRIDNGR